MRKLTAIGSLLFVLAACAPNAGTSDTTGEPSASIPSSQSMDTNEPQSTDDIWKGDLLSGMHRVTIKTSMGDIVLELNADAAPKTVTNFIGLARTGYYDGLMFHRVIPDFMIQGGDPNGNGTGGRSLFGEMFEDEIDANAALYQTGYVTGVVAMANRGPDTNGSQFFIMDADYPLPPNYTIFGKVLEGQDVVHAIARVPRNQQNDMPLEPVTFSVELE